MIEPASLISRLMAFVLAGCLTILAALAAALTEMFPLDRTQVFFLSSAPESGRQIAITKFDVNARNLESFKENFIREYVVVRNQIMSNYPAMQRKWRADSSGLVFEYSSPDVFAGFMRTAMWGAIMANKYDPFTFRCDVSTGPVLPREKGADSWTYAVRMAYACGDEITGQVLRKDFTIAVALAFQDSTDYTERFDNPLGLKVVGYAVEDGAGDPLDFDWMKQ